ncbi:MULTISPECIES: hypothetical protein [Halobacterium]|uniref:hypothetical protein n=1 Tax=Halobacterium TaxID=2239 RepID=UPI00073F2671|nr:MULTISPECIES: hypothetical protein [Halobacterium]MCG1003752.1 hypothetical protein [Halobacterium noricense]
MQGRRVVTELRRPEYTGENRCLPCTLLNLALVAVVALVLAARVAPAVGVVAVVLGAALVWARGYVVPGTPTLTKRYLPERVLAYFEHGGPADTASNAGAEFDPERALVTAGALEPCADGEDLCLARAFRRSWRSAMPAAADDVDGVLDSMLPASFDDSASVEFRGATVVARVENTSIAKWPSRAAFVADAAGAVALSDADPGWDERGFAERTQLLAGLRLWLDRCSVCDGRVELGEETVESCCRSVPVVAASCTSCGERIFEAPLPEK